MRNVTLPVSRLRAVRPLRSSPYPYEKGPHPTRMRAFAFPKGLEQAQRADYLAAFFACASAMISSGRSMSLIEALPVATMRSSGRITRPMFST